jgi:hypothetical protein
MKRGVFSLMIFLSATVGTQAQSLVIGEKAPEIRVARWYEERPPTLAGKAVLIDFFLASDVRAAANLFRLNELQKACDGRLHVVLVTRDGLDKMAPLVDGKGCAFYIGQDDGGKTFSDYGVRFVPFSVLVDVRGRLIWTGNAVALTDEALEKLLK